MMASHVHKKTITKENTTERETDITPQMFELLD